MKPPEKQRYPWHLPHPEWHLPNPENADVFALQAVAKGTANAGQQQRAWMFIMNFLCDPDGMTFWPGGEDGRRVSDFAEGRRWVGLQLRRLERMRPEMPRENS